MNMYNVYTLYMTKNTGWWSRRDIPAAKLPFTYRITTLSFPLKSCRSRYNRVVIFLKGLFFASASDNFRAGNESVKIRYMTGSGDVGHVTWRHRHFSLGDLQLDQLHIQRSAGKKGFSSRPGRGLVFAPPHFFCLKDCISHFLFSLKSSAFLKENSRIERFVEESVHCLAVCS